MGEFQRLQRYWWVHFMFYIDNFDLVLDLNSRDCLKSLAFVLLYYFADLPWHKILSADTALACVPRIEFKMLSWNEACLAEEHFSPFAEPLDYARQPSFGGPIDHERFHATFLKIYATRK